MSGFLLNMSLARFLTWILSIIGSVPVIANGQEDSRSGMRQRRDGTIAEGSHGVGLRVTAARLTLLETVRDGDHLGVEAIDFGRCDRVGRIAPSDRLGHLALQVNCQALRALTAAGLVPRLEPAGSPARFEGRVGDNHHHVMCRSYGVVADVGCAVGGAPARPRPTTTALGRRGRSHLLGPVPRLFHRPQFLSTVIRPLRKDSNV